MKLKETICGLNMSITESMTVCNFKSAGGIHTLLLLLTFHAVMSERDHES